MEPYYDHVLFGQVTGEGEGTIVHSIFAVVCGISDWSSGSGFVFSQCFRVFSSHRKKDRACNFKLKLPTNQGL